MKYFIKTFGCQMNTSDSERIAAFLENKNYLLAEKIEDANLAIFNTCGIKQTAENRAYSMIHNLRKAKGKEVSIIMTGCLANRADVQKRMKNSVDIFTEIKNFQQEFQKINPSNNKETTILSNRDYLSTAPKYTNSFQAYVPIMTGCNNFCSYCVVPYARGREVSRPAEEIISEVENLVAKGFKHIMLLGQNVNSYKGAWNNNEMDFPTLLKKLDKITGKFWLSFVSSHPKDMGSELIETVAKCKKVCEWIHLPVQAGNDEILRRMNRKYTQAHYMKQIRKIRAAFKKYKAEVPFAITSDIIVGFPGETKSQFSDSEELMKKAKFDLVFFGQFSPRPETVAWKMKDNVSNEEKERRENALNEILKKTTFANNKKYVGKKMEVLIEKEKDGIFFGKTRTQKNIKIITSKKDLIGTFAKVKIIKANIWNLEGKL